MAAVLAPRDYQPVVVLFRRIGVLAGVRGATHGTVVRGVADRTPAGEAIVAHETPSVL
jgi:hypothetical protein